MSLHLISRLPSPRLCAVLTFALLTPLLAADTATRPSTAAAFANHYGRSADDFLKSEQAQRPIDLQTLDQPLLAAAIFHETNRVRVEHQLRPLTHAPQLSTAAEMHAKDMVAGDFFAHENALDPKKHSPMDRVKLAGYRPGFVAENIATAFAIQYEAGKPYYPVPGGVSYSPRGRPIEPHTYASFAKDLVQRWMDSPGHRANILSKEPTQLGNGVAVKPAEEEGALETVYAAQNFGAPLR